MNKTTAQTSIKKINAEITSLTPSSLIQLFEIDLSDLVFSRGLIGVGDDKKIFRFHNNIKLVNTSIVWQGKTFIAAPITAEGFEFSSKGTLPVPKLGITTSEEGIAALSLLKSIMRELGDLVGGKVTRIRTFARYLDAENFYAVDENGAAILSQPIERTSIPAGFQPDPNAEFPKDVFYIDRKSNESKTIIEFELASLLDIEGIKFPRRLVVSNRCVFRYRGEGCCYEYNANRSDIHDGMELPDSAPPAANRNNEKLSTILGRNVVMRGKYDPRKSYQIGDGVFVSKDGINYYFVAKAIPLQPPPNTAYWLADECSYSTKGCKMRWGSSGSVIIGGADSSKIAKGKLPMGTFPAVNKLAQ